MINTKKTERIVIYAPKGTSKKIRKISGNVSLWIKELLVKSLTK